MNFLRKALFPPLPLIHLFFISLCTKSKLPNFLANILQIIQYQILDWFVCLQSPPSIHLSLFHFLLGRFCQQVNYKKVCQTACKLLSNSQLDLSFFNLLLSFKFKCFFNCSICIIFFVVKVFVSIIQIFFSSVCYALFLDIFDSCSICC